MQQESILYPMIGMVFLTLAVGMRMLFLRIQAVKAGTLDLSYFLTLQGGVLPEGVAKAQRNYINLFEVPVLFYVVVVLIFAMHRADVAFVALAWGYLILRIAHSVIHTTYNGLLHRRNVFLLSLVVLYAMWIRILVQLVSS